MLDRNKCLKNISSSSNNSNKENNMSNRDFFGSESNSNNLNRNVIATTNFAKNSYEGKVIWEALNRAGRNPNLKGHIHEILFRDSYNFDPRNILNGKRAVLVKNPTAKCVDIVIKKGNLVIERLQLKDTPNSIHKVFRQIENGHYNSAKVLATNETNVLLKEKLKGSKIGKTVNSSKISTFRTTELAKKAGAANSGTLTSALKSSAKSGAMYGGVISGGISAISGINDLVNGDKEVDEVVVDVVKSTAGGAVSGAAASMAATSTGALVSSAMTGIGAGAALTTVATVAAPIAVAVGVGCVVSGILSSIFD